MAAPGGLHAFAALEDQVKANTAALRQLSDQIAEQSATVQLLADGRRKSAWCGWWSSLNANVKLGIMFAFINSAARSLAFGTVLSGYTHQTGTLSDLDQPWRSERGSRPSIQSQRVNNDRIEPEACNVRSVRSPVRPAAPPPFAAATSTCSPDRSPTSRMGASARRKPSLAP